jgi:hypothetical protein
MFSPILERGLFIFEIYEQQKRIQKERRIGQLEILSMDQILEIVGR